MSFGCDVVSRYRLGVSLAFPASSWRRAQVSVWHGVSHPREATRRVSVSGGVSAFLYSFANSRALLDRGYPYVCRCTRQHDSLPSYIETRNASLMPGVLPDTWWRVDVSLGWAKTRRQIRPPCRPVCDPPGRGPHARLRDCALGSLLVFWNTVRRRYCSQAQRRIILARV